MDRDYFIVLIVGKVRVGKSDVMNIVSLKDEPLLKVITKITKMKWVLERQWKARKRQFIKAIISY